MSVPQPAPATFESPTRDVSLRTLLRQLATVLPDGTLADTIAGGPPLETFRTADEPPRLESASLLEPGELRAIAVPQGDTTPFAAFLDGKQESRIIRHERRGVPIVYGTVGAVVRVRNDRRMSTWKHTVGHKLYVPSELVSPELKNALSTINIQIVDTSALGDSRTELVLHPFALGDAALKAVRKEREAAELGLAEAWCLQAGGPLFVDGGISARERLATNEAVVGVVKNHQTLYVEGRGLEVVFGLGAGERTSVFEVASRTRSSVASWYLRLRDPAGHDPMWGLVRVEIALPRANGESLSERADHASRQILAEVSPVALPDGRWDRMVYGIRDCEEFLRSVM